MLIYDGPLLGRNTSTFVHESFTSLLIANAKISKTEFLYIDVFLTIIQCMYAFSEEKLCMC